MKTAPTTNETPEQAAEQLLASLDTIIAAYDREIAELTHELQVASFHRIEATQHDSDTVSPRFVAGSRRRAA